MAKKSKDPLVGKYFHSVEADRKTIEWQGRVVSRVSEGHYLLQLFEWIGGSESNQVIVPVTSMAYWLIYDTSEEMIGEYRDYYRRKKAA